MTVIIPHHKTSAEARVVVEKAIGDLLKMSSSLQVVEDRKEWTGNTLTFNGHVKYGFVSIPVTVKVLVDETNVTIDTELPGLIKQLLGEDKIQASITKKLTPLLT